MVRTPGDVQHHSLGAVIRTPEFNPEVLRLPLERNIVVSFKI